MFLRILTPALILLAPVAASASAERVPLHTPPGKMVTMYREIDRPAASAIAKCHPEASKGYLCEARNHELRMKAKSEAGTRLSER